MAAIDDAINSLSPQDLDLLNSDSDMLNQFKAKYSSPTSTGMGDVATQAVSAALPSKDAFTPLAPDNLQPGLLGAVKGGAETALQTFRDPTRISATLSAPGQVASESDTAGKANQALEGIGIPQPVSKFVEQVMLDPQTYLGLEPGQLPKGIQKQLAGLGEVLSGVDRRSFMELANNPGAVLSAEPSSVTGKAFQAAKEAAGMTQAEERQLATKEGFRKRIYNKVLDKIDNLPNEPGDVVKVASPDGKLPEQALTYKGSLIQDSPEKLKEMGFSDQEIKKMQEPAFDLSADVPGHPAKSTLNKSTLEEMGYEIPSKDNISVGDLLKAKKAGQLMAQADPTTSGFLYKEINQKINPLIEELSPEVAAAQHASHMSLVKEAFQNIFPQGKGMYKYIRTLGMLSGSMFHGIGALESPVVAGAATLAGNAASKVLLSPAAMMQTPKLLGKFNDAFNVPQLQSLKDRLNNGQSK